MIEKNIQDFWELKNTFNTPKILKEKIIEYYTEDFINNYSKWSENLKLANSNIKEFLVEKQFPMTYYDDISFDWFCKYIVKYLSEWIDVNGDITIDDIKLMTDKMIDEYLALTIDKYNKHTTSLAYLMESIKKIHIT